MKRFLALGCLVVGCIGPQDDPSQLRDLRVIGAQMDPPEVMVDPKASFGMESCVQLFSQATGVSGVLDGGALPNIDAGTPSFLTPEALRLVALLAAEVQMRWLVLDPKGGGRDIEYELRACARTDDSECDDQGYFVSLGKGTTKAGEITLRSRIAAQFLVTLPDGGTSSLDGGADGPRLLIFETLQNDPYKGLGGIRVPLVLRVSAGTEQVYAQKLMVYSCKWFPDQKANQQPILSGVTVDGKDWPESTDGGPTVTLKLGDELKITPNDFSANEESYVVPTFSLQPFQLKESWKFAWHTSNGKMRPNSSGGTLFNGETGRPRSIWAPQLDAGVGNDPFDVDFWVVVRDGRGGENWLNRKARFTP